MAQREVKEKGARNIAIYCWQMVTRCGRGLHPRSLEIGAATKSFAPRHLLISARLYLAEARQTLTQEHGTTSKT
jgi:hypothetical protein